MLTVSEIFLSIQGEGTRAGRPCAMIRLSGCNLRCTWCDTQYAWEGGENMSVDQILAAAGEFQCPLVEVTGGEPLIQPEVLRLLSRLLDSGYETLLETNGSLDISQVDPRVVRIVDFKCPGSGEDPRNLWANVEHLTDRDEVKFVLVDRTDYVFARGALREYALTEKCPVIFSPVLGRLEPSALADWILEDKLDVRIGLQLHRIIFPQKDRGA